MRHTERRVRKSHGGENLVSPGKLDAGGQLEQSNNNYTCEQEAGKKTSVTTINELYICKLNHL